MAAEAGKMLKDDDSELDIAAVIEENNTALATVVATIDTNHNAINTLRHMVTETHAGNVFGAFTPYGEVAENGTHLYELIVPATHKMHLRDVFLFTDSALVSVEIIYNATLTTGVTPITAYNTNETAGSSNIILKSNPTNISGTTIYWTWTGAGKFSLVTSEAIDEIILGEGTHLIRITQKESGTKNLFSNILWIEEEL